MGTVPGETLPHMAPDTRIGSQQRSDPNNVIKCNTSHKGLSFKIKKKSKAI